MDIQQVNEAVAQLREAFTEIQQPRSDYALERFVVGEKDTEPLAYAQCVLELQIKYNAIRRALLTQQKLDIEIETLSATGDALDALTAQEKGIDREEVELAVIGALREFECLYAIYQAFPHHYTHAELQAAQDGYWHARLMRQAETELAATGSIGVGNRDALRQAGATVKPLEGGTRFYEFPQPSQLRSQLRNGTAKELQ